MTVVDWMVYALAISLFLTLAAWLLDRGLSQLGVPTRWVWLGALALSLGLPAVAPLRAPELSSHSGQAEVPDLEPAAVALAMPDELGAASGIVAVLDILDRWMFGIDQALLSGSALLPVGTAAGRWIVGLWSLASVLLAFVVCWSMLRLTGHVRAGPRENVLGRQVRVLRNLGPATVGLFTPEIVLPRWATELPPRELELVLRHEEEHARSRDPLLLAIGLVPFIAAPWNPVIWWQLRGLHRAMEVDCDRRVLRGGVAPFQYGDLLLKLRSNALGSVPLVLTMSGSPPLLERRLAAMRTTRFRTAFPAAVASVIAAVALTAVACGTQPPAAEESLDEGEVASIGQRDTQDRPAPPEVPLPELNRDIARLQAALVEFSDGPARIETLEVIPAASASSELRRLLYELVSVRSELEVLRDRYADDSPSVRELLALVETIETRAIPHVLRRIIHELKLMAARTSG